MSPPPGVTARTRAERPRPGDTKAGNDMGGPGHGRSRLLVGQLTRRAPHGPATTAGSHNTGGQYLRWTRPRMVNPRACQNTGTSGSEHGVSRRRPGYTTVGPASPRSVHTSACNPTGQPGHVLATVRVVHTTGGLSTDGKPGRGQATPRSVEATCCLNKGPGRPGQRPGRLRAGQPIWRPKNRRDRKRTCQSRGGPSY
jgi:hypothetical protein